jgi:phage tail sheath gpL-like
MANHLVKINNSESQVDMERLALSDQANNRFQFGQRFMKYLRTCMGGSKSAKFVVGVNAASASGTFTLVSVIATDAVKINGVTFTCVASGATGDQFNVGADDTATAVALAAAINASVTALVSGYVTATSALGVVTVTAAQPGLLGNAVTIESLDATITASGARLTGGDQGATEKTYYFGSAS